MIQSIFILNAQGNIIIEKHYRGVLNRNICDYFLDELAKANGTKEISPVIQTQKHYLVNISRNDCFYLAVVQGEFPPLLVLVAYYFKNNIN